ncbi:hypothetical protein C1645_826346 [Glomus cerebriforme]|uniref:Mitochondrial distribution and morphology protein 12 n=1 Tax=Glomus cerebriforme TaxID=658196 RepID=A0A397SUZ3_9GLOM|nr:hypothetical protein C1645_826346 [Glomus cerebriforme]
MSFDIFWDKLDKQVAQKVQDIINEQFQNSNNKPSFIGDIEISEFDFGTIPPSVEIIDVTDPFPEFYLPDNAVVDVDVKSDFVESGRNGSGAGSGVRNGSGGVGAGVGTGIGTERERTRESVLSGGQQTPNNTASSSFSRSNSIHNNHNNSNNNSNNNNNNRSPLFTSTPIVTPSSSSVFSDPSIDYLNYQGQQQQRLQEQARSNGIPLNLNRDYNHQIDDQIQFDESLNSEEEEVSLKQDTDAQIHIAISYKGNMKMTVSTELYMNYPSLMFMSLPVRLNITGFEFSATAVVAYLRNRINFCFLEPKDSEESPLKEVHIESEIGDIEKQVLKNVGKLEKFIVDQLRKIIDEDFVFPSYHSIEL